MLTEDNKVINYRTCCKDHVSARINENGVKTWKIRLKQGSRGLFARVLNFQGLDLKKPGAKT